MKIAVIGGGIFGITVAVRLAQKRHDIFLFEKNRDILSAASGINQFRLHRGYHYPRSKETGRESLRALPLFLKEYPGVVVPGIKHHYVVAKEGSLTTAEEHSRFCKALNIESRPISPKFVNHKNVEGCFSVKEQLFDVSTLKKLCYLKIKKHKIKLLLNTEFKDKDFKNYDKVVICAYADTNSLLKKWPEKRRKYQFKVAEKPVAKLPKELLKKSVVVVDGPFMCLDHFGKSDHFVLGNVKHSIHQSNLGYYPRISAKLKPLLNKGVVKNPSVTNFKKFIESGSEFVPALKKAKHVGSMFTIRTVLAHNEKTDSRPTLVTKINDKVISVFSGKVANCILAADEVEKIIDA